MIKKKTVLVIGAGAHVPYGFPTGLSLRGEILSLHASDVFAAKAASDRSLFEGFKFAFHRSRHNSIDAFLEDRKEFLDIGKRSIAQILLKYEHTHAKRAESIILAHEKADDDWLAFLMNEKVAPKTVNDILDNALTFVTFNYDRVLEIQLREILNARFKPNSADLDEIMNRIPIHHIHGHLGKLPWQMTGSDGAPQPFGTNPPDAASIGIACQSMQLVHETQAAATAIELANRALSLAERILFLGFSYDQRNMAKLTLPNQRIQNGHTYINGSAYKLTDTEREEVRGLQFKCPKPPVELCPGNAEHGCYEFLRNVRSFRD